MYVFYEEKKELKNGVPISIVRTNMLILSMAEFEDDPDLYVLKPLKYIGIEVWQVRLLRFCTFSWGNQQIKAMFQYDWLKEKINIKEEEEEEERYGSQSCKTKLIKNLYNHN